MTQTTDRQYAVPAAEGAPETPYTIEDLDAASSVEGAADPDKIEATAVLVTEIEFDGSDIDDLPLLDGELEEGIASIFASLHAAAEDADDDEADAFDDDVDLEAVDTSTFQLLGELERLWQRAA